jgi:hypothetical protein
MPDKASLMLGGRFYELQPDFAKRVALEEAFGQPLFAIAGLFIETRAPLNAVLEALAIITVWAPGESSDLGRKVVNAGIAHVLRALQEFFLLTLGLKTEEPDDQ